MKATLLLILLVVVLVAAPTALFFLSSGTSLEFAGPVEVIGVETPVPLRYANPHGLRRLTVRLEQDGQQHSVFEQTAPPNRLTFWRSSLPPQELTVAVGTKEATGLTDGPVRLIVEAQSNDLRGRVDTLAADIQINTQPPRLTVDNHQHYINHGGCELVVFTVSGYWTDAGVRVGEHTFRSFPYPGAPRTPGEPSKRFAMFAIPWDMPADTVPLVYASNPSGAEVTSRFWFKTFGKPFRSRRLDLPPDFVARMVERLDPGGEGDLVARFLRVNGEMRRRNNQALAELRSKTEPRLLWSGPFLQLANSKVESRFADARDYYLDGKKIDHQVHLGFDLSVTQNVDVVAANNGKVIFADDLGIYGNCVVVDHGYGLQSIYAHLSAFAVKPGDAVKKGQVLGKSGQTGLAGGDHLHFSMQLDGVQVNPVEWWDAHWLQDRIFSKLPAGESAPSGQ